MSLQKIQCRDFQDDRRCHKVFWLTDMADIMTWVIFKLQVSRLTFFLSHLAIHQTAKLCTFNSFSCRSRFKVPLPADQFWSQCLSIYDANRKPQFLNHCHWGELCASIFSQHTLLHDWWTLRLCRWHESSTDPRLLDKISFIRSVSPKTSRFRYFEISQEGCQWCARKCWVWSASSTAFFHRIPKWNGS